MSSRVDVFLIRKCSGVITGTDVVRLLDALMGAVRRAGALEMRQWAGVREFGRACVADQGEGDGPVHRASASPWENAYAESYHARLRDEIAGTGRVRDAAAGAGIAGELAQEEYNQERPQCCALGLYKTPEAFAARRRAEPCSAIRCFAGLSTTSNVSWELLRNDWYRIRGRITIMSKRWRNRPIPVPFGAILRSISTDEARARAWWDYRQIGLEHFFTGCQPMTRIVLEVQAGPEVGPG